MREQIYNASIPKAKSKSEHFFWQATCLCFALCFALFFPLSNIAAAADWGATEQQLAKQIVAVTGPGTVSLALENRSSLSRRDSDVVQNGLRNALEQSGIHFVTSEQAAARIALTLSENETSYVWVAEIRQGAGDSAVVMVSVPRSGHSGAAYEAMPIALRKVPVWAQEGQILDLTVLEENGTPTRIAVLGVEDVSVYRAQNGKWQLEQTLQVSHTRPWPLDLRGRLVPAMDHSLTAYLPGTMCRVTLAAAPLTIACHASDDPWPIVMTNLSSTIFPSAGSNAPAGGVVSPLTGFFASTRNYFTGVLSPAVGKFSTVPKFYTAAFVPREKYTLWLFASADEKVHLIDGMNDQASAFPWGSDISGVRTACGAGAQVLATGAGDPAQDSIRAYEFPDRDPVVVSAAVDFPGPISALWTEARSDSAIAIARNRDTGSYEAFRLSLACGQ